MNHYRNFHVLQAFQRYVLTIPLVVVLLCGLSADERPLEKRFAGPPNEPPSRDFDFLHLRLECAFDWDEGRVDATVTHEFKAFRDGARSLELDAVGISVQSVTEPGGRELHFESLPETLRIDLGRETQRGEQLEVSITYQAKPRDGLYFFQPDDADPDAPKQLWTQGEPYGTRHWIPCFDHPVDKVTTEVIVTVPQPLRALSNGRLVSVEDVEGGARVFHWSQAKPHSCYLLCIVAGDFAVWKSSAAGVPLEGYTRPEFADLAERSFELTGDMLEFYNQKLDFPYPWEKYTQVCVYRFIAGGMENTSLTTLTEGTLHDERAALDVSSRSLVAHELVHHWFGDLVTCKDWADLWLNESFATFYANLYTEHHLGWEEAVYERYEQQQAYLKEARERYVRRLSSRSYSRPHDLFDRHSYPMGARILNTLRYVLGEEAFDSGVQHYLKEHAYEAVETGDLRTAMEAATGQSLRWFFDQWIHGGGHPRYKVDSTWDARTQQLRVTVEQTQKVDALTPLFDMPVVFSVVTSAGRMEHRVRVARKTESFSFPVAERPLLVRFDPGDWILKEVEFEKSRDELLYQLEFDDDVMGRHWAAGELKKFAFDDGVGEVLRRRLDDEPFWGVRRAIAASLQDVGGEKTREVLVARLETDPKAPVRVEIARVLGEVGGNEVPGALRRAVDVDRSYFVAAAALRALGKLSGADARNDLVKALGVPSHLETIRRAAIETLVKELNMPEAWRQDLLDRLSGFCESRYEPRLRSAALAGVGRIGKEWSGKEESREPLKTLEKYLDDPVVRVRLSAIGALGELGDQRAVASLKKRRAKELPRMFRNPREAIDKALKQLQGPADLTELRGEVEALKSGNEELKKRLSDLEARLDKRGATDGSE